MTDAASLHRAVHGDGAPTVLIHGTATDGDSWLTQIATLKGAKLLTYDRRGTPRSPLPEGAVGWSVEQHADELIELIDAELGGKPTVAIGSSFGAVVALEAARRKTGHIAALVLIEPPLPEADDAPTMPESYQSTFEMVAERDGGPAAGAFFLRSVIGKEAFEAMPERWRERACQLYPQIRLDTAALSEYRPRYAELAELKVPTLLVGGAKSALHFRATLHALARAMPEARLEVMPKAGHMLHAEAARDFAKLVAELTAGLPG